MIYYHRNKYVYENIENWEFPMSILDSFLVGKYQSEYLTLVDRYKDLKRNSIFCRYYNVNENASSELNTISYNKFSSYDVYDYTPLFKIDQVSDTVSDNQQQSGLSFSAEFSASTYTIVGPKINDIVTFPYEANDKKLIYRVKNLTTSLNGNVKFFNLNLEYAAITSIDSLKLVNRYVYLIPEGINITSIYYLEFIKHLANIKNQLESIEFDSSLELYLDFDHYENLIIFDFLNKFDSYFYNVNKPFYCLNKTFEKKREAPELIKLLNKVSVEIENAHI